jgi:hypothetical protein
VGKKIFEMKNLLLAAVIGFLFFSCTSHWEYKIVSLKGEVNNYYLKSEANSKVFKISTDAQRREVRDSKGNLEYTIEKDGTIRLPNGKVKGTIKNGEVRDPNGKVVLKQDKDGTISLPNGRVQGTIKNGNVRDSNGRIVFKQDKDRVVDNQGRTRYRVTPLDKPDAQLLQIAIKDSTFIKR